jgi:Fe-S-cluster-containing hydrogenase component 2
VTYVITEPCIGCRDKSCIDECPVDAVYEGLSMSYIHPDVCIDCGACEVVCPVDAIFYEDDVPPDSIRFIMAGQDFASRVPDGGGRGVEYGFDSPLIFLPGGESEARVSTLAAEAIAIAATEPSPFFQGKAGTRIAVLWDLRAINLEIVTALLPLFDKVAVIGEYGLGADASRSGQWQLLVEMGLVAQIPVAEMVAAIDTDSVRSLFDVLVARDVVTWVADHVPAWRKSVVREAFRRLGEPAEAMARAVPRDAATLDIASTVICWMFEEATAVHGVSVHDVATERVTVDAFKEVATGLVATARTVTLPCEWVLPPCSAASVEQLVDFRATAGPSYRRYLDRLTDAMTSLSRQTDTAATGGNYTPDQVADEVYALRRLMRELPWLGRGYVGFGLIGNAGLPRLQDAENVARTVTTLRAAQGARARPRGLFTVEGARASWI